MMAKRGGIGPPKVLWTTAAITCVVALGVVLAIKLL